MGASAERSATGCVLHHSSDGFPLCFHLTRAFTEHLLSNCCLPNVTRFWRYRRYKTQYLHSKELFLLKERRQEADICCMPGAALGVTDILRQAAQHLRFKEAENKPGGKEGVRSQVSWPLRSPRSCFSPRRSPLPCCPEANIQKPLQNSY